MEAVPREFDVLRGRAGSRRSDLRLLLVFPLDGAYVDVVVGLVVLHNQAIDPNITLEVIEVAVKALQALDPPKAKLDELARKVGLEQKFKKKDDVPKAIR